MSQRNESMPFHPFQNMFQTYFGGLDTAAQSFEPMVKGMARWQLETMGLMSMNPDNRHITIVSAGAGTELWVLENVLRTSR